MIVLILMELILKCDSVLIEFYEGDERALIPNIKVTKVMLAQENRPEIQVIMMSKRHTH